MSKLNEQLYLEIQRCLCCEEPVFDLDQKGLWLPLVDAFCERLLFDCLATHQLSVHNHPDTGLEVRSSLGEILEEAYIYWDERAQRAVSITKRLDKCLKLYDKLKKKREEDRENG